MSSRPPSSYPAAAQSELCLLQERPWALDSGNPLHEGDSRHKPAIEAHDGDKAAIVALKIVENLHNHKAGQFIFEN